MNKFRGICHVNLGDKKRGLRFNMYALGTMCSGMNISVTEIPEALNDSRQLVALPWLIYGGLCAFLGHNVVPDFEYDDVCDWCMSLGEEDADLISETFMASQTLMNESNNGIKRNVVQEIKEDKAKKN